MKAIIYENYGSPDVLKFQEVEKPIPKENEVLVKVHTSTVNRTDCGALRGKPYIFRFFIGGLVRPKKKIMGSVFAGEIEAIGSAVKSFQVGEKVFGFNDEVLSSFAQYLTIAENDAILPMPKNSTYEETAANVEGTHYALNFINKVNLKEGQKILVNGATGAIGSAAVQLLKYFGMEVVAVANTKNMELVKSLGADLVIDYLKEDFTQLNEKFEFVFDAVGKSSFGKCKPLLHKGGKYISSELGWMAQNIFYALTTPLLGNKKVIFPIPENTKESLVFIKKIMEEGKLKAVIDRRYPLEEVAEAFRYVETGEKTGNVVIDISHD